MKLIVGLGNPGRRYAHTRHNVGFDVLDEFAKRHNTRILRRSCRSLIGTASVSGKDILLAKPQTFMNLSGDAVYDLCRTYGVAPSELVAVYDDLDLPLGKVRIRPKGSAGGHKGMASIIQRLKTNEFPRIRIGIGRSGEETVDYVLSRFTRNEMGEIKTAVKTAADALEMMVRQGIEPAMNYYNCGTRD